MAKVLIFAVILLSFTEGIDWGQAWQGLHGPNSEHVSKKERLKLIEIPSGV